MRVWELKELLKSYDDDKLILVEVECYDYNADIIEIHLVHDILVLEIGGSCIYKYE